MGCGCPNVLLGMPGLRQLRILCSVDDITFRDVIIVGAAEWLDRCMLRERQKCKKVKRKQS